MIKMGFFLIKKRDEPKEVLQTSFSLVKKDMLKVFEWLNFLYHQNMHQDRIIHDLQKQLNFMPKNKEELRDLIDEYYSLEPLQKNIQKLSQKIDSFEEDNRAISSLKYKIEEISSKLSSIETPAAAISHLTHKIEELKSKISSIEDSHEPLKRNLDDYSIRLEKLEKPVISHYPQKQISNLRENLIRKIAKSGKDHVKTIIKSLIMKYGQISSLNLREIIVEEQGLCSKSSFYRILEELEKDEDISVIHEKKEKKYTYSSVKLN